MLAWTQARANRGLVTILWICPWMNPPTALAIDGPNVFSRLPTRVRPWLDSAEAAWSVRPVTSRRLVISFVSLSVRAFWIAGSCTSGSTFAT